MASSVENYTNMLRLKDVMKRTGLGRSTIYALMAKGKFPLPVKIGERCVAWVESELIAWQQKRISERAAKEKVVNPYHKIITA